MFNRTNSIDEVRGVQKPFFVVCNGVNEPKVLHRKVKTAIDEMIFERNKGLKAGVVYVGEYSTKMEVPIDSI